MKFCKSRLISVIFWASFLSIMPLLLNATHYVVIQRQSAQEKHYYQVMDLYKEFNITFYAVIDTDKRIITTVFDRDVPMQIPAIQTLDMRATCEDGAIVLNSRPPIPIPLSEGNHSIPISYSMDDWGFEKLRGYHRCHLVVTKTFNLTLPYNVPRVLELKSIVVIPDSLL